MYYLSYNIGHKHYTVSVFDNGDMIGEIHDWETGKNKTIIETEHLDSDGRIVKTRHVKENPE